MSFDLEDDYNHIESSSEAWAILSRNFYDDRGIIRRTNKHRIPLSNELEAINFLCIEYDYEWEGLKP